MGRSDELRAFEELLDSLAAGRPCHLLVVGDAGIGKTVLLQAAAAAARARGVSVLEVTGVPGERALPGATLWLLASRLEAVGVESEAIEELRAVSARASAGPPLLRALAVAAAMSPVLLVADDVHWWDPLSVAALQFAARRLAVDPVAVLAAGRPQVLEDRGFAAVPRLEVGPVPRDLAGELARSVAPETVESVARGLWSRLGGNTLAVVETAARLTPDEQRGTAPVPEDLPVGPGVVTRWASEVDTLPERSRLALAVLAVVSADETLGAALSAAGVDAEDLLPAEAGGLVRLDALRWQFRHPLVRPAVLAAEPPATVRRAHAAAADALVGLATTPHLVLRRARHRAAAALGPEASLARDLTAEAELLARLGAHGAAADAYDLAAAADPDPASAAERLARAAAHALEDFDDDSAVRLGRAGLAHSPEPRVRGSLLRITGAALGRVQNATEGRHLLTRSLDLLEGPERAEAARDLLFTLDLTTEPEARVRALVDELGPADLLAPVDRLLLAHTVFHVDPGAEARLTLEQALLAVDDDEAVASGRTVETLMNAAFCLGLEVSAPRLRRAVVTLSSSGDPRRRLEGLGIDQMLAFWDGRWRHLLDMVEETRELTEAIGRVDLYSDGLELQVLARRALAAEFAPVLARARTLMSAAGMDYWAAALPGEEAMLALAEGRTERAIELVSSELDHLPAHTSAHAVHADHLVTLTEALADAGRVGDAAEVRERLRLMLGASPSALGEGFLARTAAAVAEDAEVADLLGEAEGFLEVGMHVFELAMTRLRLARWLRRHRRRREAAERLELALAAFEHLECRTWADQCRAELRAVGVDVTRHDRYDTRAQLTAQERRVVDVVGAGATNDEAARQLFLSPRTVEAHLTHVYRKLGVRGRTELARLATAHDGPSSRTLVRNP
ncbi:helix-turn-helix transcriptional regulator [Longivirga aurantiaca]|uniref:AAA family ATPase n=1 Tax=Longivirga aurantiaca TaxID=1837743 RepID=A0ABW1T513_9ACTN